MREVYSDGNPPPPSEGTRCTLEERMTVDSDADSADINVIIRKYNMQPLHLQLGWSGKVGEYADVSALPTYREALDIVNRAEATFMELPPDIRAKFDNSHVRMLDAFQHGELADVFEEIGYLERKPKVDDAAVAAAARKARIDEIAEGVAAGQRRTSDGRFTYDEPPRGGSR